MDFLQLSDRCTYTCTRIYATEVRGFTPLWLTLLNFKDKFLGNNTELFYLDVLLIENVFKPCSFKSVAVHLLRRFCLHVV